MIAKRKLRDDETGATAIEYALLAGLIAMVIIGATFALGQKLDAIFHGTNDELVAHMTNATP